MCKILEILMIYSLCSSLSMASKLDFDSRLKEVIAKPDAKVVHVAFNYTNKTDKNITIKNFDAPCTCMDARMVREDKKRSLIIAPGEKGQIIGALEFENFKGTIDKVIKVYTEDDHKDKPSIILTCRVTIPVLIGTDKDGLKWKVGEKLTQKVVNIKVASESETPIKIVKVIAGYGVDEYFKYTLNTIKEGREYNVTVTPLKTNTPTIGVIRFYTDSKIPRYKKVHTFVNIDHPKKK